MRSVGCHLKVAHGWARNLDFDSNVIGWKNRRDSVCPLDQDDPTRREDLVDPEIQEFVDVAEAVRVAVKDREWGFVFLDQNKGGAVDKSSIGAEPGGDRLHEPRFPRTKLSHKRHQSAAGKRVSERVTENLGFALVAGREVPALA